VQSLQVDCPCSFWALPAGQLWQAALLAESVKVPALHNPHVRSLDDVAAVVT